MNSVILSTVRPILLVDASYYVFHRYHATLKWYSFQNKSSDNDSAASMTPEFVDAFKRHFAADMVKWKKRWRVDTNVVFCGDCPRSEIWRNEIYPEYKGTRVTNAAFDPAIFPIFYGILEQGKYNIVSAPRLEADDVVYLMIKKLLQLNSAQMFFVLTNDNDYLQLRSMSDNISIHNMHAKPEKSDLSLRSKGSPELDLCLKIIAGDQSDNIPGIKAKMGPKTALSLAQEISLQMDPESKLAVIAKLGPECVARYQMNERLVSFQHIPEELADSFLRSMLI